MFFERLELLLSSISDSIKSAKLYSSSSNRYLSSSWEDLKQRVKKNQKKKWRKDLKSLDGMLSRLKSSIMGLSDAELRGLPKVPEEIIHLAYFLKENDIGGRLQEHNQGLSKKRKPSKKCEGFDPNFDRNIYAVIPSGKECVICMCDVGNMAYPEYCSNEHPEIICMECAKNCYAEKKACPLCREPLSKPPSIKLIPKGERLILSACKNLGIHPSAFKRKIPSAGECGEWWEW